MKTIALISAMLVAVEGIKVGWEIGASSAGYDANAEFAARKDELNTANKNRLTT
mgnify:CR=1 FL=1